MTPATCECGQRGNDRLRILQGSWRQTTHGAFVNASLCESCQHLREIRTARSKFLLCELSATDASYPKYPRQPVVQCDGYRPTNGPSKDERPA